MPEDKKKEEGGFAIGKSGIGGSDPIGGFLDISLNGMLNHASFHSDKGIFTLKGVFVPNPSTQTEMEKILKQSLTKNAGSIQVTFVIQEQPRQDDALLDAEDKPFELDKSVLTENPPAPPKDSKKT